MRRAVFLDRDGTIHVDNGFVHLPEQVQFVPGAIEGIRLLNRRGFIVIVVTNQSGVARGLYTEDDVQRLHNWMGTALQQQGARIDAFYYCPHHPEATVPAYRVECDCRKPRPGLLQRAASEFSVDLERSFIIGDRVSDIEVGLAVGCQAILLQDASGAGCSEAPPGVWEATTLLEGVRLIIQMDSRADMTGALWIPGH